MKYGSSLTEVNAVNKEEFRNHQDARVELAGITCYRRKDIISAMGIKYQRLAIQTHFIGRGESYSTLIEKYILPVYQNGNILSISEKAITMCQNHVTEKKDVVPGFWSKFLSQFASSNQYGVAMDEPYKLQLAIDLCGLPQILLAVFCSAVTKLLGIHGVFYRVAGHGIAGIDGFYPDSAFELYRSIALLSPVEPKKVCDEIQEKYQINCMIVDANDLNIEILAKSDSLFAVSNNELSSLIQDNPAGQLDERTPFILLRPVAERNE